MLGSSKVYSLCVRHILNLIPVFFSELLYVLNIRHLEDFESSNIRFSKAFKSCSTVILQILVVSNNINARKIEMTLFTGNEDIVQQFEGH